MKSLLKIVIPATLLIMGHNLVAQDNNITLTLPEWITKTTIKGNMRARFEDVEVNNSTSKSRFRGRVRIGAYGDVNSQMDWGFRISSGSDESATSSNQSFDDFSSKRKIWMDLGWFGYRPNELNDLYAAIGKMKKPWKGVSGLVFDGDLNPEGANIQYAFPAINIQCGYYLMKDNLTGNNPTLDINMLAAQLDGNITITENIKLHTGLAGFLYSNIKDAEVVKSDSDKYLSKGNSVRTITADDGTATEYWINDFQEVDAFAYLNINRGPAPFKIFGEYVINVAADSSDDDGWKVGLKTKYKKFHAEYNYRELGRDAVLGVLADSDFGGGGTGTKGHTFKFKYDVFKNCALGFITKQADNYASQRDVETYQFDIMVNF